MFNCLKVTKPIRDDRLLLIANPPAIPGTHFIDLGRMKGWLDNLSIRLKWCSGILMSGTIYPSAVPSILIAVILFPACKPCVIIIFPWQYRSSRSQNFSKVFLKFCNIRKKTPVLESLFNKVAGLQACNFIEKRLQQRCFPVNIAKSLRTVFYRKPLVAVSDNNLAVTNLSFNKEEYNFQN